MKQCGKAKFKQVISLPPLASAQDWLGGLRSSSGDDKSAEFWVLIWRLYLNHIELWGGIFPRFFSGRAEWNWCIESCVLSDRVQLRSTGVVTVAGWSIFVVDRQWHFSIARGLNPWLTAKVLWKRTKCSINKGFSPLEWTWAIGKGIYSLAGEGINLRNELPKLFPLWVGIVGYQCPIADGCW
jgi:hypothetical protein